MRIRKLGLGVAIITILLFLMEYHFFYLFPYPGTMERLFYDLRYATLAAIAILMFFYLLTFRRNMICDYDRWMIPYCVMALCVFCVFVIYSQVIYPQQKLIDTLAYGGRYACILFVIPILFLFERDGGPQQLMKHLNIIAFIWYVYTIIQSLIYAQTGNFLFNFREYFYADVNMRNGALRVGAGALGGIFFVYNVARLLYGKEKRKIFSVVMAILGAYHIIFLQQTRMMILAGTICVAVLVLLYGRNRNQQIIRALFIIAIGVFIVFSPAVRNFISSFSASSGEYGGSAIAREYATAYYLGVFASNPLMGFAWPADVDYADIAHGSLGVAYTTDVGIVGLLAEQGIFSLLTFALPIGRMIYILVKTKNNEKTEMRMFLIALVVYVMATAITLIITDVNRCLAFSIILALFEYYYKACRRGELHEDINH